MPAPEEGEHVIQIGQVGFHGYVVDPYVPSQPKAVTTRSSFNSQLTRLYPIGVPVVRIHQAEEWLRGKDVPLREDG